jgi:hypothetical protein
MRIIQTVFTKVFLESSSKKDQFPLMVEGDSGGKIRLAGGRLFR